jgi:hypothetical protein
VSLLAAITYIQTTPRLATAVLLLLYATPTALLLLLLPLHSVLLLSVLLLQQVFNEVCMFIQERCCAVWQCMRLDPHHTHTTWGACLHHLGGFDCDPLNTLRAGQDRLLECNQRGGHLHTTARHSTAATAGV